MDDGGMEEGGSESLRHTERLPVTHKPGGRAVERRTYFQALELSKALPRTHGQTYVPPSRPRPVPPPCKSHTCKSVLGPLEETVAEMYLNKVKTGFI